MGLYGICECTQKEEGGSPQSCIDEGGRLTPMYLVLVILVSLGIYRGVTPRGKNVRYLTRNMTHVAYDIKSHLPVLPLAIILTIAWSGHTFSRVKAFKLSYTTPLSR